MISLVTYILFSKLFMKFKKLNDEDNKLNDEDPFVLILTNEDEDFIANESFLMRI